MSLCHSVSLRKVLLIAAATAAQLSTTAESLVFLYGVVHFRKLNPPKANWERDHKTASATGMHVFRHRVMWSAVEVLPGRYNWRDYD